MAVRSEKSVAKPRDKTSFIAQEIAFAKVLAGNDKKLREKAVKKLRRWLQARAQKKCEFTEDDFMRIWTGLFYCMWMSDKFLVQEELAESLSNLIHCFKGNNEYALLFIKCFQKTLALEWSGLDQYRIDKFSMLARRVLRQSFQFCKQVNWEESLLKNLMTVFTETVLHSSTPLGFQFHFIDIYLEELAKVGGGNLEKEMVPVFIEPFIKLSSTTRDARVRVQVNNFLKHLIKQTDVGLEYEEKFQAWKEEKFPGSDPYAMEAVKDEEECPLDEDVMEDGGPMDPRAGSVHVSLPQIQFDIDTICALLKKYQFKSDSTIKGKKMILNWIKRFDVVKQGKYPTDIKNPLAYQKKKSRKKIIKKSVKRLMKFSEKIKKGRLKNSLRLEDLNKDFELENNEDLSKDFELENNEDLKDSDENTVEQKKLVKRKLKPAEENGKLTPSGKLTEAKPEKRSPRSPVKSPEQKSIKSPSDSFTIEPIVGNSTDLNITPVRKRKISGDWQVDEMDKDECSKLNLPKIIKIEKKCHAEVDTPTLVNVVQSPKKVEKMEVDDWKEPLKEGEVEIFIPNKKFHQKQVQKEGQLPVFFDKAKAKAMGKRKSGFVLNPAAAVAAASAVEERNNTGSKRISFALNFNMSQDNEEYLQEVKNSPKIPFDGTRKPVQSALKSGLSPSPINPFYRLRKK